MPAEIGGGGGGGGEGGRRRDVRKSPTSPVQGRYFTGDSTKIPPWRVSPFDGCMGPGLLSLGFTLVLRTRTALMIRAH